MTKSVLVLFFGLTLLFGCKKEEEAVKYNYKYKLTGIYARDTAIKSDGYKSLNLNQDGNYCWTRVIKGLDSNFCYYKYIQTSDTSLLWEGNTLIYIKITPIDSIPKRMQLQVFETLNMPLLYGYYE
jgi:hypothetical protein